MNWLTSRCAPLVAVAALAVLVGCDKGTDLNVDLPETTAVNTSYKDIPLEVATVRLPSVQTLKGDHFMVGRLADNVAGTTTAGTYSNVIDAGSINTVITATGGIPTDSLPAGLNTPQLDSVVLVAGFDRVYGSTAAPAQFDVFKLAAPLDERQAGYDSNTLVTLDPTPLGQNLTSRLDRTQVQVVTPADTANSTRAGTPAVTAIVPDPTVRLVLQRTAVPAGTRPAVTAVPSPFFDDLFNDFKTSGFSQPRLDTKLKGIAILPNASHAGSIVSFSKTYKSRIVVYYHIAGTRYPKRVYSIYFGPTFSGLGLAPSRDPRYYSTISTALPPALAALATRSGAVSAAALSGTSYAQEGTGLATRVTLQGRVTLKSLTNQSSDTSGVVINRAELIVPIKPYTNVLYTNPSQLFALEVDANNVVLQRTINYVPVERIVQADGQNPVGTGNPATGVITDAAAQSYYTIPVTSYLQTYLYNDPATNPKYLVLTPSIRSSSALSLNRAALDANNIRLRVYYSRKR
ncbi:DUF4270 family protein [Hymenobacter convexus]|uniref:DUF4270 family protein n=1 Tax=Hymenobacter sp. CA1UV-4 TaxID=3063782 RepID=UPI00271257DF|nr:DUF4270 family protein [Hymenobacter sp. CA1UV-4]MDO7850931.1 DUF4270 family protein [Hymenobacter sp. CA1UV-4]